MSEPFTVVDNREDHQFEVTLGADKAFAEYRLVEGGIILPHTDVPTAFEGKGVGGALAKFAMAYAREHGLKVIPTCTFMAGYITRHPEHHDLVHPDFRERLGVR